MSPFNFLVSEFTDTAKSLSIWMFECAFCVWFFACGRKYGDRKYVRRQRRTQGFHRSRSRYPYPHQSFLYLDNSHLICLLSCCLCVCRKEVMIPWIHLKFKRFCKKLRNSEHLQNLKLQKLRQTCLLLTTATNYFTPYLPTNTSSAPEKNKYIRAHDDNLVQ